MVLKNYMLDYHISSDERIMLQKENKLNMKNKMQCEYQQYDKV